MSRPTTSGSGGSVLANIVAVAIATIVVIASTGRLYFGVDFTDEAYYAAIPYRFVLGDAPYTSELNIRQNAALLITPLVQLWVFVQDGTDGLMLFLRYADLFARIALAGLAFRAVVRRVPAHLAVVVASTVCAFVFFSIPALSYNTIAAAAFTGSALCLLLWTETARMPFAVATIALAFVAAFVHPGVALVSAATAVAVVATAPTPALRRRSRWLLGVFLLASVLLVLALALYLGRDNVTRLMSVGATYAGPPPNPQRLLNQTRKLMTLTHLSWILGALWIALWFLHRLRQWPSIVLLGAYVALAIADRGEIGMVWLTVGSIPLAVATLRFGGGHDLLIVSILSVCAGLMVSMFSTNGLWNMAIGANAAVIVFFVAMHHILRAQSRNGAQTRLATLIPTGLAALTSLGLVVAQWDYVFRDDAIPALTSVVADGPYRGLHTTPAKREFLARLQAAMRSNSANKRSLLAFYGFPAAHLLIPVRPALATTWVANYDEEYMKTMRADLATLVPSAPRPMLVLQVFRIPMTSSEEQRWRYGVDDPLVRALNNANPRAITVGRDFALYEVNGGT